MSSFLVPDPRGGPVADPSLTGGVPGTTGSATGRHVDGDRAEGLVSAESRAGSGPLLCVLDDVAPTPSFPRFPLLLLPH